MKRRYADIEAMQSSLKNKRADRVDAEFPEAKICKNRGDVEFHEAQMCRYRGDAELAEAQT
jgi:hypothetical protein